MPKRLLLFSLTLLLLFLPASACAAWGQMDLDRAVENLAETLVVNGDLKSMAEPAVYISPHDLYDGDTGLALPFASLLREKLVAEMRRHNINVLLPGVEAERFMMMQGVWQKEGKDLSITLKVIRLGPDGPVALAAATEKVPLKRIDAALLTPDRESWAAFLVRKLEENAPYRVRLTVHARPFVSGGGQKYSDDLGGYMRGWLGPALAKSSLFDPLDQTKGMRKLSTATIRTRGTRGIGRKSTKETTSITTDLLNAEAELQGEVWRNGETVEIRTKVIDRQGRQVTAATAAMPADLFPAALFEPPPEPVIAFPASDTAEFQGVSVNGLRLELTTTGGEERPRYREGEKIRMVMRLNRPAYIYLFDLNPAGEAVLLYPADAEGKLINSGPCGSVQQAGVPVIVPEDGCSYDLVAMEPFGTDTVWAVAAESPLNLPADLGGEWGKTESLVRNIRQQGMACKDGYSDASLELTTMP